ncbi:MAG: hypothetical protein JNN03_12970 [Rubrivivax sp.]|nr:hypothetical protein [Rubrivivax sp.]
MNGFRLLGWLVHVAFFAAWIQVALIMDRQLHDEPRQNAPTPEASAGRLPLEGATTADRPSRARGGGLAERDGSAGNARDLKPRAG